ncbi:MAG: signal peptidase I [Ruminococcaceae bacterium]|nr:signal peptidase I [Oscillospiraceae bacterium]
MAKHAKQKQRFFQGQVFKRTLKIVLIIIVAASLLLNLFTFIMPVVKYYGNSMSPTLEDGQILIVNRMAEIKSGDIIAFYYNNKVIVRRVVAAGNSQVSIDAFGTVSVNGKALDEPYVEKKTLGQSNLVFPYNVPTNAYFVLGDNRDVAMDSRLSEIGVVTEDRLLGKVVFSLQPFGSVQ